MASRRRAEPPPRTTRVAMKVSVVLCTWNRAVLLDRALTHIEKLQIPTDVQWEVIVVNNNSTDSTEEVIARHKKGLPLRNFFEPKQGVSHARNLASQEATG